MMQEVKKEDVFVSSSDDIDTIRKKIAYYEKTIPEYIRVDEIYGQLDEQLDERIKYQNIEKMASHEKYQGVFPYIDFYNDTIGWKLKPIDNLMVWILGQKSSLSDDEKYVLISLIQMDTTLNNAFAGVQQEIPNLFMKKRKQFVEESNVKKKTFLNKYKKEIEVIRIISKLNKVNATEFILDRSNFKISIENKYRYSILDIFNMIDTSEIIPYVVVNDEDTYYKINKHIKPPKEWIEVEKYKENGIMLKILGTEKFTSDKIGSQYVDVMIMIDENSIVITMQTITLKGITQEETVNRLQKSIKLNISDYILTNVSIAGTFYIPLQNIDMDIFSDMAMNDKIISRYIDIDEHVKLQKKKTQTYIYFYESNNVIATANITNQIVEPRDSILRTLSEKDREYFPVGSSYLRIRITKTQDNDSLNIFYNIFRKLISRYNQESENVAKFYKKYGIELLRESEKPSGKKIKKWLKDIDHDIFGPESKYTRQCEKKREPRIVNDEEAELLKSKGIDVMKYPRDGAIGIQRNYVCDQKDDKGNVVYKYPGVTENNKGTADHIKKYPMLPCCFINPQRNNSKWNAYFESKEQEETKHRTVASRIIQGSKILQVGQVGELPIDIKTLLETYANDSVYRKGVVSITKNNFLETVMSVMDTEYQELKSVGTDDLELKAYCIAKRIEFGKAALELIAQENYEYTIEEIKENIENQDTYFDPRRYYKLLENYYKCNIMIFSHDDIDGTLSLPNHTMNYNVWDFKYPVTIMIYEHMGSEESDPVEYPQCEIIIVNIENEMIKIMKDTELYNQLNILFNEINKSYYLSIENKPHHISEWISPYVGIDDKFIKISKYQNVEIESQYIDNNGKTRILNIVYNNDKISVMVSPMPNLSVRYKNIDESQNTGTINNILEFIRHIGAAISHKVCVKQDSDYLCKEIHASDGYNQYIFPVNTSINDNDIVNKICKATNIPNVMQEFNNTTEESKLQQFNNLRNIAVWIEQYNYWLFSRYCKQQNIPIETIDESYGNIFDDYVTSNIEIVEKHDYIVPDQLFSTNSTMLTSGKLIISSKNTKNNNDLVRRLVYLLKMQIQTQPSYIGGQKNYNSVKFFHENKIMKQRYKNIEDFDKVPNEIIFKSANMIYKWLNQQSQELIISYELLPDHKMPYLLQNQSITGNNIMLCNCTDTLIKAYNIGKIWLTDQYNAVDIDQMTSLDNIGDFNLILPYKSGIKIHKIITNEPDKYKSNINIVGYLINGIPQYTTLLQL